MYAELGRCGLLDLQRKWLEIAKAGYCTMNADVGKWTLECAGVDFDVRKSMHVLGLKRMVQLATPQFSAMLEDHHDAGVDAQIARLIYVALLCRARPYMRTRTADTKGNGAPTPKGSEQRDALEVVEDIVNEPTDLQQGADEEGPKKDFKPEIATPTLAVADQHGPDEGMNMIQAAYHEFSLEQEARGRSA